MSDKIKVEFVGKYIEPYLPSYGSLFASGADVRADLKEVYELKPGTSFACGTGLKLHLPEGFEIQARPRSGLAFKNKVVGFFGTVDNDYQGEVAILLFNFGDTSFFIEPNMRVAQLVLSRFYQLEYEFGSIEHVTERGSKGFGSTGL